MIFGINDFDCFIKLQNKLKLKMLKNKILLDKIETNVYQDPWIMINKSASIILFFKDDLIFLMKVSSSCMKIINY